MKKTRKLWAFLLAMIMVLAMGMSAMAAGTGSITITSPEGLADDVTNTYKIYKVFDADGDGTNISYKLVEGKETPPYGFSVDGAGNVTFPKDNLDDVDISMLAIYVTEEDLVATVITTGTESKTVNNLSNGYYYITTSTGAAVIIDSTNPDVEVTDKNTVPELDKKITGANSVDDDGKKALAQVGSMVEYTATITVGNGAKGYVFYDKMSNGLDFAGNVIIKVNGGIITTPQCYTYEEGKESDPYTFKISFDDGYMKNVEAGSKIVITYSAIINDDAVINDPEKNTAYLSYGETTSNNRTPNSETEVYNAKFTVTKKDGKGDPLEGAGFVLKNAEDKYYKLNGTVVSWVDSIDEATEYTSDGDGAVQAFTGLANGTYTLVEKTVPAGYNKAADSTFTIAEHDYTVANLEQSTAVVNNAGAELPSTGGIGTTMFYVAGGALVLAAVVLLVTRKRMSVEK